MMNDILRIQDGQVVAMNYSLYVEGEMVDSSEGDEPLEYLHGYGNIVPGLERELAGLAVGENKTVVVAATDGYGERDEEAGMDVPLSAFPADAELKVGLEMQLEDEDGNPMYACIDKMDGETVHLDFNHPLAGKELHFEVTVVSLRPATESELDHGHPHTHGHHH
jgi:FKBP-type peptidyl-prolyl cis-trans isomerase SlyD